MNTSATHLDGAVQFSRSENLSNLVANSISDANCKADFNYILFFNYLSEAHPNRPKRKQNYFKK